MAVASGPARRRGLPRPALDRRLHDRRSSGRSPRWSSPAGWGFSLALRSRVVYPLQTLSNLLAGLREGDSSVRARGAVANDALGEVMLEANVLADTLREQRLGALEATSLLRKVMEEIDVAVFTFDGRTPACA